MNDELTLYLQHKKRQKLSPRTLKTDYYVLKKYVEHPVKNWPQMYYEHGRYTSTFTMISDHRRLKAFCTWLEEIGRIQENPFRRLKPPKAPRTLPKFLDENQINSLMHMCESHSFKCRAIFSTFLYTGLRKSELLKLAIEHVDLENCTITVIAGKGAKDRKVPIAKNLYLILSKWQRERPQDIRYFAICDKTLRCWKKDIQDKLDFDFTIHQLRHTTATMLVKNNVDISKVAKILGHSSLKTTMKYVHNVVDHLRDDMDMLNF